MELHKPLTALFLVAILLLKRSYIGTVYKKNGRYYCRYQLNGERHHIACKDITSLKAARLYENTAKLMSLNGIDINSPKKEKLVKMSRLYSLIFNYSRLNKKSFRTDCVMLGIIKDYFKDMYVKNVTPDYLEHFKDYLLNVREVKASTVNRYNALLSKMFNLAIENEIIDSNPVKKVKKLRENNYKIRFLTKQIMCKSV